MQSNAVLVREVSIDELLAQISFLLDEKRKVDAPQSSTSDEEEYLTLQQTCSFFNRTPQTIHNWKKSGKIPYYRVGGCIYFKKSELISTMRRIKRKGGYSG